MPRDSQYAQVSVDETGDASPVEPPRKMVCGVERRHRKAATIVVCLFTAFIFAVNGGVLLVVVPTIARDFSTTNEVAAWANIAPGFISAMIGTQMGWVADKYGRAKTWHVGMTFELISHAVCGWAQTIPQLLFGRAVGGVGMGIGAGSAFGLMAAGMPPKQRGIAAAWIMLMGTLGRSFGTSIGGVIMDAVGWRWLFIGPVPALVAMWIVAYFVLPFDNAAPGGGQAPGASKPPAPKKNVKLDWMGSVVLAVLMAFLLLGVNRGNEWGWDSPRIIGSFIAFAVLAPVLFCVEMRCEKTPLFGAIHSFSDHFAKTGSGQTHMKTQNKRRFVQRCGPRDTVRHLYGPGERVLHHHDGPQQLQHRGLPNALDLPPGTTIMVAMSQYITTQCQPCEISYRYNMVDCFRV